MPIISNVEPKASYANFFKSPEELDDWALKPKNLHRLEGLLGYTPRSKVHEHDHETHGKLLVCHDYKGGYTESPSSLAYTFNFWDRCDTFIYFSHQRVTIPPPGWINAAHRQGVKILGVLIFEHEESMEDTLRLILGKLPKSRTGPPATLANNGLPVSSHYARALADLAYERGFDGYLLNFEFPFSGQSEQARALEAWISLLNAELKRKVGDYAEVIWYDSVITTGQLRWQDQLNSRNLSFFLPSDGFFTNYTWPSPFPLFSAQYLLSLPSDLFQRKNKTLRDIYIGIDVWGRGSHGGGGLGAFRAAEHVDPRNLGLSVALFGPAWTWESDEGREGRTWEEWWECERTLWLGPSIEGAHVEVPDPPPLREGEQPCPHGEFKPLSEFFPTKAPPKPDLVPFCATFCPGIGYAWFVEGRKVMYKENGWTDVDKQTSLGNLLWPRPKVAWEGDKLDESLPKASTNLVFDDAFNSGSSVTITLDGEGSSDEGPAFRCIWIPVQSIAVAPGGLYEVELVYKVSSESESEFDLALSIKSEDDAKSKMEIKPLSSGGYESGWSRVSITCKPNSRPTGSSNSDSNSDVPGHVGIILALASESASLPYTITIHLGQLRVSPKSPLSDAQPFITRLLWADCTRVDSNSNSEAEVEERDTDTLLITWDACILYTSPARIRAEDLVPEVPHPPWTLNRSPTWFPHIQYANIYAQPHSSSSPTNLDVCPTEGAVFLGTSGWGSGPVTSIGPNAFLFEKSRLSETRTSLQEGRVRFYVQGVTDRGEVLPWERCAFVDFDW